MRDTEGTLKNILRGRKEGNERENAILLIKNPKIQMLPTDEHILEMD